MINWMRVSLALCQSFKKYLNVLHHDIAVIDVKKRCNVTYITECTPLKNETSLRCPGA